MPIKKTNKAKTVRKAAAKADAKVNSYKAKTNETRLANNKREADQFGYGLKPTGVSFFGKDVKNKNKKAGVDGRTGAAVTDRSAKKRRYDGWKTEQESTVRSINLAIRRAKTPEEADKLKARLKKEKEFYKKKLESLR